MRSRYYYYLPTVLRCYYARLSDHNYVSDLILGHVLFRQDQVGAAQVQSVKITVVQQRKRATDKQMVWVMISKHYYHTKNISLNGLDLSLSFQCVLN